MGKITDSAVALRDGFMNVISGLGGSVDGHSSGAQWYLRPVTQHEIEASYRGSWISRKVHDIPATDMLAPWRSWDGTPDQITALIKEERRLGLKRKTRKALIASRMYGGAAIMIGIAGDDPSQPIDLNTVKQGSLSYLHVLTRHEVTIDGMNLDPGSSGYGEPLAYIVNGGGSMVRVHPSRMARFTFGELPDQLAMGQSGWGDPLLMSLRDALVNADTAQGAFAALATKARTSTLKVPGLVNLVSTKDGEEKFIQRTRVAKAFESMFALNIISAPSRPGEAGEEWQTETINFGGVPDMGMWLVQMTAAAASMPMTKMVGASPGGLNSTGTGDEDNYIQMLSAGRELDVTPPLDMIDEVLIRSATGGRDEKIAYGWEPFQSESEKDKVANSKSRAEAIKTLADSQAVPSEVLMKLAKGQIIDSGDYPGAEDAYAEYDAAGEVEPLPEVEADNDNEALLNSVTEGLVSQGKSASVAARDAVALLDSTPRPLYVCRMVLNRDDLQAWATEQGLGELQPDLHTTILYSRQPVDWIEMGNDWGQFGKNEGEPSAVVPEGGPRVVDPLGDRGAVLMFAATDLQYRHEEMVRKGASHDYPSYVPHVSLFKESVDLSGVTPYRGRIELGCEIFSEIKEDIKNVE